MAATFQERLAVSCKTLDVGNDSPPGRAGHRVYLPGSNPDPLRMPVQSMPKKRVVRSLVAAPAGWMCGTSFATGCWPPRDTAGNSTYTLWWARNRLATSAVS